MNDLPIFDWQMCICGYNPTIQQFQQFNKKGRHFHDSLSVGLPGFEPRQTESKSVVLPLHHNPIFPHFFGSAKIGEGGILAKKK